VYLGPVSPHWDIRHTFGEQKIIDAFRTRVNARLLLLPKHDPQFRRNRERVNRDAERELIRLEWDLGDEEAARYAAPDRSAPAAPAVQEAEPVADAPAVDDAPLADTSVDDAPLADTAVDDTAAADTADTPEATISEETTSE
jgi:hypothetical protein